MNNSSCLQPSPATTVALPILYSCLFPAGIFGNILSAWIFLRKVPTRRTQYIYLANLVAANLLVCSTMPFLAAYFAEGHRWPYESVACRIAHYLGTLVMHVSMYVTIIILCSTALSQYATLKKNCGPQHSPALPGTLPSCLQPSPATTVALPILYSCLFPAGIFGNILSAWIFLRKVPTRRTQYIYLANLVAANLLVCSTMPFLAAYFAEGHRWPYESVACRIAHYLGTLVMHVSMYVTIIILCSTALSQYATLKKNCGPQHSPALPGTLHGRLLHEFRRPKFAKYLCAVIWLIVLCITVTAITYNVQERVSGEFPTCYNIKVEAGERPAMIAAYLATLCFFLAFMTVSWSYYSLNRHLSRIQKNTCIGEKHLIYRTVKRNILVIQMILTVCFLPYHIFRPIFYVLLTDNNCPRLNYLVEIKNVLTCLAATKSSLDPVITLLLDKTFKKSLYGLFTKSTPEHQKQNNDIFIELGRNMERF